MFVFYSKDMNVLFWIIFGTLVGWVASIILEPDDSSDMTLDIVAGVIGAFLGGMILNLFGPVSINGFDLYSFVTSIIGAIILVTIVAGYRGGNSRFPIYRV